MFISDIYIIFFVYIYFFEIHVQEHFRCVFTCLNGLRDISICEFVNGKCTHVVKNMKDLKVARMCGVEIIYCSNYLGSTCMSKLNF